MEEVNADSLDEMVRRSLVARNKQTLVVNNADGTTTFCCVVCPMKYADKESMELHLCMHNKEYRFICNICGTGLKRKEHLERHTQGHYEVRPHTCPDCGKAFKRKEHLTIHSAIHTGQKSLACPLCARTFHRKDHLQKHLQSHSKKFLRQSVSLDEDTMHIKAEVPENEMNPIIYDVCGNAVEHDDIPVEESQLIPVDALRPFRCSLCPKTYKRRDHLKLHARSHLKNNFPCSECGQGFSTEGQLFVHMNAHLKAESLLEGEGILIQPELQIIEGNAPWQNLASNNRAPTKEEHRPHECQICHKRFKRRQHLNTHGNVHRRENRSIWCSLCNDGFTTNEEFEQHECRMNTEDGGDSENIDGLQMQNNVTEVAGDNCFEKGQEEPAPLPMPQRVFVCKYCSKPFRRRDHYKIHLNIHTGEKSFFCSHCGKGFYRKDHLQKHEQIHTRQKKRKEMPDLFPIRHLQRSLPTLPKLPNLPEITIHAPSNAKLRIPLQMKVPYEVVTSTEHGEQRAVIHPQEQCVR